jgi:hypothetical protein
LMVTPMTLKSTITTEVQDNGYTEHNSAENPTNTSW